MSEIEREDTRMWTNEELQEIRDRAELEANIGGLNRLWQSACLDLAASASHLLSLTERICRGEITACDPMCDPITKRKSNETK
jgi:hypothetical protein